MSEWKFPAGQEPAHLSEVAGFVYLITNNITGRMYVGRKYFWSTRGKGKMKVTKESDWRKYWGSSDKLKADILAHGKDAFTRRVLLVCATTAETNYEEVAEQFRRDVLRAKLADGTRAYWNSNIGGKWYPPRKSPMAES